VLELKNINHEFGEFKLKNINLHVKKGEYFIILGPTGAGKTLALELIAGFHIPNEGQILLAGKDATFMPPEKRNIGFVYQDYSLFSHMTVKENIAFGLKMHKVHGREGEKRVTEIMETMRITPLAERHPDTLSGGEQQRVALARAIVISPQILLLDEPLSALDPRIQETLREELFLLHKSKGMTTIHVTHNQTEALLLADRISVMMEGQVVQVDTTQGIFSRPANIDVANFVGVENIFTGEVKSNKDGVALIQTENFDVCSISNCEEGNVKIFIRPENIILSRKQVTSSARNSVKGKIMKITDLGTTVRVQLDNGLISVITKSSAEDLNLNVDQEIYAYFKASSAYASRT
jgi:molybdate/tungstate transport system ATP-binding protein